jgi:FtsZ-interacting cell division protein ZipA
MIIDVNEIRMYLLTFLALGVIFYLLFRYIKGQVRTKLRAKTAYNSKAKKEPRILESNVPRSTRETIINLPSDHANPKDKPSLDPLSFHFRLMPKIDSILVFSNIEKAMTLSRFKYTDDQIFIHRITEVHKIIVANLVEPGTLIDNHDKPIKGLTIYTEIESGSDIVLAFDTFVQLLKNIAIELNLIIYQSNMKPLTTHSIADMRSTIARNMNEPRS